MSNKKNISRKDFIRNCTTAVGGLTLSATGLQSLAGKGEQEAQGEERRSFGDAGSGHTAPAGDKAAIRGSWVQRNQPAKGDVTLVANGKGCQVSIGKNAHTALRQAAIFLAADIQKITGFLPPIVETADESTATIRLAVAGADTVPGDLKVQQLMGQKEAYHIRTRGNSVWLVGADFRGTAFAVYTLCERLGIDPLYHWSGFTPETRDGLVLKETDFYTAAPAFRYRGFFHDDEDILPRPFEANGYPMRLGDVPMEWYRKYFETALRLRMNMVAPYTRVHRRYEVQQCASDWGLFYTSHHYDILLSNPFGIERYDLAKKRGIDPQWDWFTNKKGIIGYWNGGVEENKKLYTIWPVGLRGTDDHAYDFPPNTPEDVQAKVFLEAIDTQVSLVKNALPPDYPSLFHFTLYTEMLDKYKTNRAAFNIPEEVIIVWPDDNNGIMRELPEETGKWKHGVYYHLAYFGGVNTKQSFHTVSPQTIAEQFKKIIDRKATEFMLVNTSELREFVMEARMLAEITWKGAELYKENNTGDAYIQWWCNEYFGDGDNTRLSNIYRQYYDLLNKPAITWFGSEMVQDLLDKLSRKMNGQPFTPAETGNVELLKSRDGKYQAVIRAIDVEMKGMRQEQAVFFYEQVKIGLLFDWRPTQAALLLLRALSEPDRAKAWALVGEALKPLEQLELETLRAERPPFEKWYRETWIRSYSANMNTHRPYTQLVGFISCGGKKSPVQPKPKNGHNIAAAQLWTRFVEDMEKLPNQIL
ncbi:MAG TPA: glycosyl hydrolase 115 family protein [Puia sp.]|jgi:hypothetical protein